MRIIQFEDVFRADGESDHDLLAQKLFLNLCFQRQGRGNCW